MHLNSKIKHLLILKILTKITKSVQAKHLATSLQPPFFYILIYKTIFIAKIVQRTHF